MNTATIIKSMRVSFLTLTFVCVFLGVSTVIAAGLSANLTSVTLALTGALLAHISVNTLNEYFDFVSGLDLQTQRTPFSGGSGALPDNPDMVNTVLAIGILSSVFLLLIGAYFAWQYGPGIIPVGVTGIVLIATYTGWINKHPLICLIAPGIGFGFLMVVGTQFVLQGEYNALSWLVGVIPFFLVNNLLLLNQYPDIEADSSVGRKHFPIAYGIKKSNIVYGSFVLATATTILVYVANEILPALSLIALLPIPLALFSLYGAIKYGDAIGDHPQFLAANVGVTILTTLLLAISLVMK